MIKMRYYRFRFFSPLENLIRFLRSPDSTNRNRAVCSGLLVLLILVSCKPAPVPKETALAPQKLLVPEKGAYTGAYIDFGDTEDDVTLEAIENFEDLVGKHQSIVASSSYWGEQTFPAENINIIWRHGSIPLIFWSPWDKPYEEDAGPDKFSLTSILEGKWDAYIDQWGEAAHQFGQPMFVSFCNEMNGTWFPWSGCFYGGNKIVPGSDPKKYEGPEVFKKAYRYVVDRVRAKGATNILWVFHVMNYSYPQDVWNLAAQYYPGPDYVDWMGLSVYGQQDSEDPWVEFLPLIDWPYEEMRRIDSSKPLMLAEWGIGEFPKFGSKPKFMKDFFTAVTTKYPNVKAAVFWHERWLNENDNYSNLRVNSTPESLEVYRKGMADPYWIGTPLLKQSSK